VLMHGRRVALLPADAAAAGRAIGQRRVGSQSMKSEGASSGPRMRSLTKLRNTAVSCGVLVFRILSQDGACRPAASGMRSLQAQGVPPVRFPSQHCLSCPLLIMGRCEPLDSAFHVVVMPCQEPGMAAFCRLWTATTNA
jgi:hypothetical protein